MATSFLGSVERKMVGNASSFFVTYVEPIECKFCRNVPVSNEGAPVMPDAFNMPFCPDCEKMGSRGDAYCNFCGAALQEKLCVWPETKPCNQCGHEIWPHEKFCLKCGAPRPAVQDHSPENRQKADAAILVEKNWILHFWTFLRAWLTNRFTRHSKPEAVRPPEVNRFSVRTFARPQPY